MRLKAVTQQTVEGSHATQRHMKKPLLMGLIAIQIAVPVLAFAQEPPTRLGWQMYSGIGELPEISVERSNGDITDHPFTDFAAARRAELTWQEHLPAFLCTQMRNAIAVNLIYSTGTQSFECE